MSPEHSYGADKQTQMLLSMSIVHLYSAVILHLYCAECVE